MNHDRPYHDSSDPSSSRSSSASPERGRPRYPPATQPRSESRSESRPKFFAEWGRKAGKYGFLGLRSFTLLPEAELQHRPHQKHYLIRQPRTLQYYINGQYVDATGRQVGLNDSVRNLLETIRDEDAHGPGHHKSHHSDHKVDPDLEGTLQMRSRLDLIIDLVWVGITVNISRNFEDTAFDDMTSYGHSFVLFLVIFLLSFRLWDQLRSFLNNFFNGDGFQILFVLWILVLGLIFGNNALQPQPAQQFDFLVYIYLVARGSFWLFELIYAVLIPQLRAQFYITVLMNSLSTACLIGSIFSPWKYQAMLVIIAMFLEMLIPAFMQSSLFSVYLQKKVQIAIDAEHYVERLESFFLMVIGEGILLLIKDGVLAFGLSNKFGVGAMTLMSLYLIAILYFNGDMSRRYIHAVKRNKYSAHIYLILHVVLYAALLIFDAGIAFLVKKSDDKKYEDEEEEEDEDDKYPWQHAARWMVSIALAAIFISISLLALLNKPLPDKPGSPKMLVSNRYLRLFPRLIFIMLAVCLPVIDDMRSTWYLGIVTGLIVMLFVWEYVVCLEKVDGKILLIEPRNTDDGHGHNHHHHRNSREEKRLPAIPLREGRYKREGLLPV